ncbi:MAG TPA: hypothetical protein VF173_20125 [Thermoanaerobaculia bacterium]|nr:hypothetical protein [Thermoanaerobaculia bacterium]
MKRLSVVCILGLMVLAVPALAVDHTIYNGSDLWRTPGNGMTFADFSKQPIPAGFFCNKSETFTGRIILQGVPIATSQPGILGATDTIIQRLDNATFNKNGVATTRIQMRAMQFQSVAPVQTACGAFNAFLTLDGEQPITTMRIVRENSNGGRFYAPIYVNVKISFKPVGRVTTEAIELRKSLRFPPATNAPWAAARYTGAPRESFLKVDTDSDGIPDTFVPGTSNIAAGRPSSREKAAQTVCHIEDEGQHCAVVYSEPIGTSLE